MRILKALIFAVAVLGAGCTSFDNRVACTVDGKRAFFISEYSRVGISAEITKSDAAAICNARR